MAEKYSVMPAGSGNPYPENTARHAAYEEGRASLSLPAAGQEPVAEVMFDEGKKYIQYTMPLELIPTGTRFYAAPQPAVAPQGFPILKPELAKILGTMCFQCIAFAQALRQAGHQINTRAEDEQAATLHWMLGHYFRHGDDGWRQAAMDDMERMRAAALPPAPSTEGESNG